MMPAVLIVSLLPFCNESVNRWLSLAYYHECDGFASARANKGYDPVIDRIDADRIVCEGKLVDK